MGLFISKVLAAKRVGKLYIFLSPDKLAAAVRSGVMKPLGGTQPKEQGVKEKNLHYRNDRGEAVFHGVSTTRNAHWKPKEHSSRDKGYWDTIRLTLDGDRISERHPIRSYNDFWKWESYSERKLKDPFYAQSEEKIITDEKGFKGWMRYLLAVDVLDVAKEAFEEKNLTFDVPVSFVSSFARKKSLAEG
jgi:hypothetical protein